MGIMWTPPAGWVEETGASIRFTAPCACSETGSSIIIGSNVYNFYLANGSPVGNNSGLFMKGAIVEAILDCETKRAYLNTPGETGISRDPIAITFEQLDATTRTGFYQVTAKYQALNNIYFNYAVMQVIDHSDYNFTQILYPIQQTTRLMRYGNISGSSVVWGEWECDNPPMYEGLAYRTTERYMGKPVYTILMNCGSVPTSAVTYTNYGEVRYVFHVSGYAVNNANGHPVALGHPYFQGAYAESTRVGLKVSGSAGYTAYVLLKYVKP